MKRIILANVLVFCLVIALVPAISGAQESDTTPPTTELTFGIPDYEGWYPDGVMVTLTATDNEGGSGVAKTQYYVGNAVDPVPTWSDETWEFMISSGDAHVYSGPFPLYWGGYTDTTLFYRSIDNAGNKEAVKSVTPKLDLFPPEISYTQTPSAPNGDNGWYTEEVNITFTCSDSQSGVAVCPGPITIGDGVTSQFYSDYAVDNVGHAWAVLVSSPVTTWFYVDTVAPTVTIYTPENYALYQNGTDVNFHFSRSDNNWVSSTIVTLNGDLLENWWNYLLGPWPLPVSDPGVYELVVKVKDYAGNETIKAITFIIYDPEGGFVTGGGCINPDSESTLPGERAEFGFVAKYKKGEPGGNLDFHYSCVEYALKSTSIDWVAIATNQAHFQGTGTINGEGFYTFRVTVKDEGEPGVGTDSFDIKIWEGTDTEANPIHKAKNLLSGGNIVVHKK